MRDLIVQMLTARRQMLLVEFSRLNSTEMEGPPCIMVDAEQLLCPTTS